MMNFIFHNMSNILSEYDFFNECDVFYSMVYKVKLKFRLTRNI